MAPSAGGWFPPAQSWAKPTAKPAFPNYVQSLAKGGIPWAKNFEKWKATSPKYNVTPGQTRVSAPAAPPGQVPGGASSSGQGQGQAQQPSPLDATYWTNIAAHQAGTNNQINSLNLNSSQALTALQAQLAQLKYQQPRDQLALEQKANQAGGLYSSVYDQNLGNLNYGYAGKQGGDIQNYTNALNANTIKASGLTSENEGYNLQQAAASTVRAATAAANNPATGDGSTPTTGAPGKATGKSGSKTAPGGKSKGGASFANFVGVRAKEGIPWAKNFEKWKATSPKYTIVPGQTRLPSPKTNAKATPKAPKANKKGRSY